MTKTEQFQLTSRLASIQNRAGSVESEAREILNDLAAGLIPTTPEVRTSLKATP